MDHDDMRAKELARRVAEYRENAPSDDMLDRLELHAQAGRIRSLRHIGGGLYQWVEGKSVVKTAKASKT